MIVVGVDPGPEDCGFGVLEITGVATRKYIVSGIVPSTLDGMKSILRMVGASCIPDLFAIERADGFAFAPYRVPHLLRSNWVGGGIAWWAEMIGLQTILVTPEEWKRSLYGKQKATDAQVLTALRVMVSGMPSVTNVHARDAIGLAIVAAQMRARGYKPELRDWGAKGRAVTAAKRVAKRKVEG